MTIKLLKCHAISKIGHSLEICSNHGNLTTGFKLKRDISMIFGSDYITVAKETLCLGDLCNIISKYLSSWED
jgi:hypothetical protein